MAFGSEERAWKRREFILTIVGVAIGVISGLWSAWRSWENDRDQKDLSAKQGQLQRKQAQLQAEQEERQSAPVLAAGVDPSSRNIRVRVPTNAGPAEKDAAAPAIKHKTLKSGTEVWRLVVPVWNVGSGLAVVRAVKALPNCDRARKEFLSTKIRAPKRLGYYNVPAGGSEQVVWRMIPEDGVAAMKRRTLSVIIRYTDPLVRRDRWTCIVWGGKQYATLFTQNYGDAPIAGGVAAAP